MKILQVFNELKFSGAEIMYVDAAPVFLGYGCELVALNTAKQIGEYHTEFEKAGYAVIHYPIPNSTAGQWMMKDRIIHFLKDCHFDAVHVHRADLAWIFAYCAHSLNIPCVYTYHNVFGYHWYSYPIKYIKRYVQRKYWKLQQTAISDSVYEHELNTYRNKTNLVYNWWGYNRFSPAAADEKWQMRDKLSIDKDALVIVSVGGCSNVKRHHDIIKALPHILKDYPNTLYLHLGNGNTLEEEIELSKSLGVYDNVRFCGNQLDVRNFLIASDIYVMTSKYEGISITTIEAMACHIPCVLYNVPGLRDFNKKYNTSVTIEENPQLLADSVISLYKDKNRQEELVAEGHRYIHETYNIYNNAKKIYEMYNQQQLAPVSGGGNY